MPDPDTPTQPSTPPADRRLLPRRVRARRRFFERRLRTMRPQLAFAGVLALAGIAVTAPVLLDDLVLRSGYIWRSAADAVDITSAVRLSEQPNITLTGGTLSIPAPLARKPKAGEALAALVKGGTIRLDLQNPVFDVDLSKTADIDGHGHEFTPQIGISPMLAAIADATFERLSIKDGTVRLILKPGHDLVLNDFNAELIVKRRTAMRFKGQFTFRGEPVSFDTTLGSRVERRGSKRTPIRARIVSDAVVAVIDGRLDWRGGPLLAASSADVSIANVRTLARWLGPVWPSGPGLRDFNASGDLEWSEGVVSMRRGLFVLDGNSASGTLQVNFNGPRPAISGTLSAAELDLTTYLPAAAAPASDRPPAEAADASLLGWLRGARDLTLPLLGFVEADVRLSADKIMVAGLTGERAAAGINLHGARLLADLASLALPDGGSAHGEFTVEGWVSPQPYSLRGEADRIDVGAATRAIAGNALASGTGSVIVDLKASGVAGLDVMSRIDGTVAVTLPDGGRALCSVQSITAAARADPPGSGDPCAGSTPLQPLTARAKFAHGVLMLEPIESRDASPPVSLSGTVDLVTKIVDFRIAAPGPSMAAEQPAGLPVTVRGRPEALTFTLP